MSDSRLPITGGCLCGAVRYESSEPPTDGGYCHCGMCRKAYGGLFGILVDFRDSAFRFTRGAPKFHKTSEWGKRGFCAECGSPLVVQYEGEPAFSLVVGSLDKPDDWSVVNEGWWGHVYVEDKVAWHAISDGLPQHKQSAGYADAAREYAEKHKDKQV